MNYENSTWDTETWNVALSAAWRYEVSRSFSITPFAKMSYVHASNKVKKDDYDDEDYDSSWWWDDDEYWRRESRWENRGSFDNMALEVGVTLEHAIRFSNGMMWTNAISRKLLPGHMAQQSPPYLQRTSGGTATPSMSPGTEAEDTLRHARPSRSNFCRASCAVKTSPFMPPIRLVSGNPTRNTGRPWA